jgi:PIN domain nuclease of toxin-antitoxin system
MEDSENDVLVSAAVAWELAIKSAIAKLDALSLTLDLSRLLAEDGFSELPIGISQRLARACCRAITAILSIV